MKYQAQEVQASRDVIGAQGEAAVAARVQQRPEVARFQARKRTLLIAAFAARVALNLSIGVAAGAVSSALVGLFVAWAFYYAMLHGSWKASFLLLLWAVVGFVDAMPLVLGGLGQYLRWAQVLVVFELAASAGFLALFCWLALAPRSREYSLAYQRQLAAQAPTPAPLETPRPVGGGEQPRRRVLARGVWDGSPVWVDLARDGARLCVGEWVYAVYEGPYYNRPFCLEAQVNGAAVRFEQTMGFGVQRRLYADGRPLPKK